MARSTDSREPNALTFAEIAEMLSSWGDLPSSESEALEDIAGYVEHMRAGDFATGHVYEPRP